MSKFEEHIEKCLALAKELEMTVDRDLLVKVAKGLGPAIYNRDASMVSCSDPEELERIKKNFLVGKLGLKDDGELDGVIAEVCGGMKGTRVKFRALFYTQLTTLTKSENEYN